MKNQRIIPIRLDPAAGKASLLSLLTCCTVFTLVARQLPGYSPFQWVDALLFVLGLPFLIAFHEAVHALAWMSSGKLPAKAFKFGILWGGFIPMPYCHCKEPLSVRVYRAGALMPLLITVPVFIAVLVLHPTSWTALLAALSLSGCIGDVWLYKKLIPMKQNDLVWDCPKEAGCDVIVKDENQTV
jgi:hypothetical protein